MRQQITKKQWDELSDDEKEYIYKIFLPNIKFDYTPILLAIGQLIEYLGEDLTSMQLIWRTGHKEEIPIWEVRAYNVQIDEYSPFEAKELIDSLWEACKYKLRNK